MKVISRKSEVELNGTILRIEDVIASLKYLPSSEIVAFFNGLQVNMPRKVRMNALHRVLDRRIKKAEFKDKFTDEINYRLKWFPSFSEHQLEGILSLISTAEIYSEYREELWLLFLKLHEELRIDTIALAELYENSRGYKNAPRESIAEYQRGMDILFYDDKNCVDGLEYNNFREVLKASSTLTELREIGTKFGIDVPRRIKKNELADIIIDELSAAGKLEQEEIEKIKRMSVMALQRYAKDNNIKASIELKKEDIIEYIIGRVETEVKKSYINLSVLDVKTEDDVYEDEEEEQVEEVVQETLEIEAEPEDNAIKSEISDLKEQINLLLQMQKQQLEKQVYGAKEEMVIVENNDVAEDTAKEEVLANENAIDMAIKAEEDRIAKLQADEEKAAQEQAVEDTNFAEEERLAQERVAEEARLAEERRLAEEKAAEEKIAQEKALEEARLAEEARIAQIKAEEEARVAAEKQALEEKLEAERKEKELLLQEVSSMRESNSLEDDDFVIPVFEFDEEPVDQPVEEEVAPIETSVVEEPVEEPVVTMEDIEASDDMLSFGMDDEVMEIEEEPVAVEEVPEEVVAVEPEETEDKFEAPSYEEEDDDYADFDTPLFETPIFEAPVFEAPVYGEDKEARGRRLMNETKSDKKRRAAEEKAIQEALKADSRITGRTRTKSNPVAKFFKILFFLIVLALVLIVAIGLCGVCGVFKEGTFLFKVYEVVRDGVKDFFGLFGGEKIIGDIFETIKGLLGQ